jgi:nucleotide-binding universal stress UspA family protein
MVSINRILCPIDFSAFSLDALRHALVLARWYSAQITLFHVYPASYPLPVDGIAGSVPVFVGADPDKITSQVREFCAPLVGPSAGNVEVVVRPGDAAREIRTHAEQLPFDLLIMGTHGNSGFERLFLGSVTEKVLRSTRVPVMTIPAPVVEPGSPLFKTILCPIDFSAASTRALEYALALAKEADARLLLLHAVEDVVDYASGGALGSLTVSEYFHQIEEDAVSRLRAVVPDEAREWSRPEERVVKGRAYTEILKVVAAERIELVVMGVQGKGALDRLVFGSTTHRVIREAGCPVLTLHSSSLGSR